MMAGWTRRVAVAMAAGVALSVAVPLGTATPIHGSRFPLADLFSGLPAWSFDRPHGPVQTSGNASRETAVTADATRANGGSGRAPETIPGAVPPDAPIARQNGTLTVPGSGRFDPATSRKIQAETTANTDVFQNADGSVTRIISAGRINFKAADGTWKAIDTNLVRGADGRWRMAASPTGMSLAGSRPAGHLGGADQLVRVTLPGGEIFGYTLTGGTIGEPAISGPYATYADVLPDTDVKIYAFDGGPKDTLILHSAKAATSWVFELELKGLTPRLDADGSVRLLNTRGTEVSRIPPGYMEDSNVDPQSGEGRVSEAVRYELVTVKGKPALKVIADAAWIADPARVFPIKVDPTLTANGSTFASTAYSNDTSGMNEIKIGKSVDGQTARGFVKFDWFGSSFFNKKITSADLYLHVFWTGGCNNTPATVYVNDTGPGWAPSTVRWSSQPIIGGGMGSGTHTPNSTICGNSSRNPEVGAWWPLSLNTTGGFQTLNRWSSGGENNGVALQTTFDNTTSWVRASSVNSGKQPYLSVTYVDNQAPIIRGQYPAHGHRTTTLTPELLVTADDADGYHWGAPLYKFFVERLNPATGAFESVVDSGNYTQNMVRWGVPAGLLTWGQTYRWTAVAWDGVMYSTNHTWNILSTAVPQPPITSMLSQNGGQGFAPAAGNFTNAVTDAQVASPGPTLAIQRSYNSRDPRTGAMFGAGWSSVLDAKAVVSGDTIVITYPSGQQVAFGRNQDGTTFVSPPGRFATLTLAPGGGYHLVDKEGTTYKFTQGTAPQFKLTSITDTQGRVLTLDYPSGTLASMTGAGGRKLFITVSGGRVTQVRNELNEQWNYTYTGNTLTKVCSPVSTTACTVYEYTPVWSHPTTVLEAGPHTYLRLSETSGSVARSVTVQDPDATDAQYVGVNLNQAGGLAAPVAGFNGGGSHVDFGRKPAVQSAWQAISVWFKASGPGVILGGQDAPIGQTASSWAPWLYVGTDGKLRGQVWNGGSSPVTTVGSVVNNGWHHAVLSVYATGQQLWLDGAYVGSISTGTIDLSWAKQLYLGAGKWEGWPGSSTSSIGYFNGQMSDFAFFTRPLADAEVVAMHASGRNTTQALQRIRRPSTGVTALVGYQSGSDTVTSVTDANGAQWTISDPVVSGSAQPYRSAVISEAPADYFRLTNTANEVNGIAGTFSNVTFNTAVPSPLNASEPTALFTRSSSSHMAGNGPSIDTSKSYSVSAWAYLTEQTGNYVVIAGDATRTAPFWLARRTDGKWYMQVCQSDIDNPSCPGAASTAAAELNKWTHLVGTVDVPTNTVKLYVNGEYQSSITFSSFWKANGGLQLGRVRWNGGFGDAWAGRIAEAATFRGVLSQETVRALYQARSQATSTGTLAKTVTVTGPPPGPGQPNAVTKHVYDLLNGGRLIEQTDVVGSTQHRTVYGYDRKGFLRSTLDPNGNQTINEHDDRGNVIATTTCQDYSANLCSTTRRGYDLPTSGLCGDKPTWVRDPRYTAATNDTTFTYDAACNVLTTTDPLGRVTRTDYSPHDKKIIPADHTGLSGTGQYLRIYGTRRGFPSAGYSLWELEVYGSTGQNLALRHPVTVSSTEGSMSASYAVDGNPVTRWSSQFSDPQWIYVDLGSPLAVSRVRLFWETAYGADYLIQVSNDTTNWTTIRTVVNQEGTAIANGLPLRTTGPSGATQTTYYNTKGDVIEMIDAAGLRTVYQTDAVGRLTSKTVKADGGDLTTAYTYDPMGRVRTQTDPPAPNAVTGANHTKRTTTTYDVDGNVSSILVTDLAGGDADRETTFGYDTFGRQNRQTDALTQNTLTEFNVHGKAIRLTKPDGVVTTTEYNHRGQPVKTTLLGWTGDPNNPTAPVDKVLETRAYDPGGRLGTVVDAMNYATDYTYTDNGLVATVTRRNGASTFVLESNVYDVAGHLTRKVTNNGTTVIDNTIDPAGQITRQVLDPSGVNRRIDYTYRRDGQVTSTQVTGTGGQQVVETFYDPLGRKTAEHVTAAGTNGLSARWNLDSDASDAVGNNPGTASNVTYSSDRGGSAVFNGTNANVVTSGPVIDTAQSFTVTAWAKLDEKGATRVIAGQRANARFAFLMMYSHILDRWSVGLGPTDTMGATLLANSNSAPTTGTWTHLAGVYDADARTLTLYVNGVAQSTVVTDIRMWSSKGAFKVGGEVNFWYKGGIDDVQVYQTALPAATVAQVHAGTSPGTPNVKRTSWKLNNRGLPTTFTDAIGTVATFEYDSAGRQTVTTTAPVASETAGGTPVVASIVSKVGYNNAGESVNTKDQRGLITTMTRDAVGQLRATQSPSYTPAGGSAIVPVASVEYHPNGLVKKTIDPRIKATTYAYDQMGRLASATAPDTGVTRYTYTMNGQQTSVTDPTGVEAQATYDFLGRVDNSTEGGHVTDYHYHPSGFLATVTPPGRSATTYTYNNAGEQTRVVDGAGVDTDFGYDFAGRQTTVTFADDSRKVVRYNSFGLADQVQVFDRFGAVYSTTTAAYDRNGRTVATRDARNSLKIFVYDAIGRMTGQFEPKTASVSISTTFGYDVAGNPTRFTNGNGYSFLTSYNPWNLPETRTEPVTTAHPNTVDRSFTSVYDAAGNVVRQDLPGGVSTTHTYDDLNRPLTSSGTGAESATTNRTLGYDLAGRITSASGSGGTNTFAYNTRGMLQTTSGPSGASSFTYTPDALTASRTDAAGTTTYGYDTGGRLSTVGNTAAGIQLLYGYNNLSQVSQITSGTNQNRRILTYHDDGSHLLATDDLKTSGGTSIAKITYGWDKNANLTSKTTTGFTGAAANTYAYDLANRLTNWNGQTYTWDDAGNRTAVGARTFSYDQRNRLMSTNDGTNYAYSPRGTLRTTTAGSVVKPTEADAFGRVVRQYSNATAYTEYVYDGLGRNVKPGFLYTGLGNDLAQDPTATYARGPGGGVVGVKPAAGAGVYAWTDLHTDVVGQFGATSTTLTGSTTYDPFGKTLAGAGMQGSLGYQSGWTDPATSRVNMHSRWYNPDTGQFDTRDSVSLSPSPSSVSANRYAYANANPLVNVDPTGQAPMATGSESDESWYRAALSPMQKAEHVAAIRNQYARARGVAAMPASAFYRPPAPTWVPPNPLHGIKDGVCIGGHIEHSDGSGLVACEAGYSNVEEYLTGNFTFETTTDCSTALENQSWLNTRNIDESLYEYVPYCGTVLKHGKSWSLNGYAYEMFGVPFASLTELEQDQVMRGAFCEHNPTMCGSQASDEAFDILLSMLPVVGTIMDGTECLFRGDGDACVWTAIGLVPLAGVAKLAKLGRVGDSMLDALKVDTKAIDGLRNRQSGFCSFSGDTQVLMADGSTTAIAELKVGDLVHAADPESGQKGAQTVTAVWVHDDTLVDLEVEGQVVETTEDHPFWNETDQEWQRADELDRGDRVLSTGGRELTTSGIQGWKLWQEPAYDLTVTDFHTFFILAGGHAVLVHNCDVAFGKKATGTYTWADKNKYKHFRDYEDTDWMAPALDAVLDQNVTLHVNLDGIGSFLDSAKAGIGGTGKSTDIEMAWIARAVANGQRDWSSVLFYRKRGDDWERVNVNLPDWSAEFGRLRPLSTAFVNPFCDCPA